MHPNEKTFWQAAAHPVELVAAQGDRFLDYLRRVMLHPAPLTDPKDLAWFLASYARDALFRVEQKTDLPALQAVRSALEQALGMKFAAEKGEHFSRSTLVQTLFYGVFSAWVRWQKDHPASGAKFDWRTAEWSLHVPFVRTLYRQIAEPNQLGELELVEVLDWAAGVLNRVQRGEFFANFEEENAVQYFYEPFLAAYDPELRKELGVWFTPREIVKYQVARVDHVLREELKLDDGLADPNVLVLDPCCGTAAYLVEVLHRIADTLRDKGALVASDLKQAAMTRVFGFEILPAPFVVAHLQLGLLLQAQGAPLSQRRGERVGVYLTNALTGWEPPKGDKATPAFREFHELQEEKDAAEHVKRDKKILVVLGNPPYNAFAGVSPEEEQGMVETYKGAYQVQRKTKKGDLVFDKTGKPKTDTRYKLNDPVSMGGWGIKKFNLDELYVRFFRLAERRIAEMSGQGVVSFISNFSYLGDPSFVIMRERFLGEFDKLWLDCLNGDSRETGKLTPDGKPDPSVFSTEYNRQGIRVGTAVCVIVRKPTRLKSPVIRFREFWGVTKRADLLDSLKTKKIDAEYTVAAPSRENRLSFRPEEVAEAYNTWPPIVALCEQEPISGLQEMRKGALMDMDRDTLAARLRDYFDTAVDWESFLVNGGGLTRDGGRFDAKKCRNKLLAAEAFSDGKIRRYSLYPFDNRWAYHSNNRPLWNEPRPEVAAQCWPGNRFLVTRPFAERPHEWAMVTITPALPDYHLLRPNIIAIPLRLEPTVTTGAQSGLFRDNKPHANLSRLARTYLGKLGIKDPDGEPKNAELLWMHALAVSYSPGYLTENADGIRRNWPRIPLPDSRQALAASAELGQQVAALLDTETDVPGVTTGKITPILKTIGPITKAGGGQLDTAGTDLEVTAGWGHFGKEGVVMPAKGKTTERQYNDAEQQAIDAEADQRNIPTAAVRVLLGDKTLDVYLNGTAYWRNIPVNVWEYVIGGYQVIKKWLSYREHEILGRALKPDEAREVTNMARRIAALLLLQPSLDANYQAVKAGSFDWNTLQ